MKKKTRDFYQRLGYGVVAAVTCQTRLHITLLVYAVIALLLLAYVSANVMTSVLTQDIAQLKQERQQRTETLNKLTSDYISKSSRARVVHYCETVLGMIPAEQNNLERFAVQKSEVDPKSMTELTAHFPTSIDLTRYTSLGANGVTKR